MGNDKFEQIIYQLNDAKSDWDEDHLNYKAIEAAIKLIEAGCDLRENCLRYSISKGDVPELDAAVYAFDMAISKYNSNILKLGK